MLRRIARRTLRESMTAFAAQTFFSKRSRVRNMGYDVLSRFQPRVLCMPANGGEQYVVKAADQYLGRDVFVTGEFEFHKFGQALRLVAEHRDGWQPKVLINVGANIGTICIPAVARGLVESALAIEAEPDNTRLLRANIALNGLDDRITAVGAAAGAEDGKTLTLELACDNFGDHRVRVSDAPGEFGEAGREVISVPSSTIDTLAAGLPLDDTFLWMDVQGFEGFVLAGAKSILAKKQPLVLEFGPYYMDRAQAWEPLRQSISHYTGFIDLSSDHVLRPMSQLEALRNELTGTSFTDILVL
jgi:FkbM family methyltransferase